MSYQFTLTFKYQCSPQHLKESIIFLTGWTRRRSQIHGPWGSWRSKGARQVKDPRSSERWIPNCNGRTAEEKGRALWTE